MRRMPKRGEPDEFEEFTVVGEESRVEDDVADAEFTDTALPNEDLDELVEVRLVSDEPIDDTETAQQVFRQHPEDPDELTNGESPSRPDTPFYYGPASLEDELPAAESTEKPRRSRRQAKADPQGRESRFRKPLVVVTAAAVAIAVAVVVGSSLFSGQPSTVAGHAGASATKLAEVRLRDARQLERRVQARQLRAERSAEMQKRRSAASRRRERQRDAISKRQQARTKPKAADPGVVPAPVEPVAPPAYVPSEPSGGSGGGGGGADDVPGGGWGWR